MEHTERTVSELSSLFRMLQVIPDADSVARVYPMLLSFCTTWRTIGVERAVLLLVDSRDAVVRGHLAAEQESLPDDMDSAGSSPESFEALAKRAFQNYERIDASDVTLKARSFTVPLDWHRCAIVKAAVGGHAVLAERRMSEFATDPFFTFFGSGAYIAVPIEVHGSVTAVLAADNVISQRPIEMDDVSLLHGLAHQAALAVERVLEVNDNRRKFRILRKLQDILSDAATPEALSEGLTLGLSMVCRAVGGTGVFLKDLVRQKTVHIKAVDEYTLEADDSDVSIGRSFEKILDRAAGTLKRVDGDGGHPLLDEVASQQVEFFLAVPVAYGGDSLGALAVYVERRDARGRRTRMAAGHRTFLELCAGMIGQRLGLFHTRRRAERSEVMFDEVQSHLAREREGSRIGARAMEYYRAVAREIASLKNIVYSHLPHEQRIARIRDLVGRLDEEITDYRDELDRMRSTLREVDLFALVAGAVDEWRPHVERDGVEVTVRIPRRGPRLLMDAPKVRTAVGNILRTLTGCVAERDRVLVECSVSDDKAVVCFADTGKGVPGDLLSRLFMPFSEVDHDDEHKSAMSLAGDILHRHSGEIMVKSSPSWRTILVVTFPLAANQDRRRRRRDRRGQRRDRRTEPAHNH